MAIKTVPNQKVIKVNKEICNKDNKYAAINLEAMESAACELDAGAFKLWIYFAKNQNGYEFALSQKAVEECFGMKKKQYDNAVNQLIEKGFLVVSKGNHYIFNEKIPVVPKGNNEWLPKDTMRSNQKIPEILQDTTNNNTVAAEPQQTDRSKIEATRAVVNSSTDASGKFLF